MEKWPILQLEQRKQKGREHRVVPESKGVMQRQKDEGMSKGRAEEHLPRPPPPARAQGGPI